jgi:hypothetical protein
MDDPDAEALLANAIPHSLGEDDRTMAAPGATDRDRQVVASLLLKSLQQHAEKTLGVGQEVLGGILLEHVPGDGSVEARQGPQGKVPVWIGQETNIEDDVRVEWEAVLVPKRDDGGLESLRGLAVREVGTERSDVSSIRSAPSRKGVSKSRSRWIPTAIE